MPYACKIVFFSKITSFTQILLKIVILKTLVLKLYCAEWAREIPDEDLGWVPEIYILLTHLLDDSNTRRLRLHFETHYAEMVPWGWFPRLWFCLTSSLYFHKVNMFRTRPLLLLPLQARKHSLFSQLCWRTAYFLLLSAAINSPIDSFFTISPNKNVFTHGCHVLLWLFQNYCWCWACLTFTRLCNSFILRFYLFIYSWETQRDRQKEKQASCREPKEGLNPGPGITPWAKGRWSTIEPPRCPRLYNSWNKTSSYSLLILSQSSTQNPACCRYPLYVCWMIKFA